MGLGRGVQDQTTAPKYGHVLIPGTREYVTLPGERDLAGLITLMIWRWEMTLGHHVSPVAPKGP